MGLQRAYEAKEDCRTGGDALSGGVPVRAEHPVHILSFYSFSHHFTPQAHMKQMKTAEQEAARFLAVLPCAHAHPLHVHTFSPFFTLLAHAQAYMKQMKTAEQEAARFLAVFPCVLSILPTCIFNKKDPIVLGVEIVEGIAKVRGKIKLLHSPACTDSVGAGAKPEPALTEGTSAALVLLQYRFSTASAQLSLQQEGPVCAWRGDCKGHSQVRE